MKIVDVLGGKARESGVDEVIGSRPRRELSRELAAGGRFSLRFRQRLRIEAVFEDRANTGFAVAFQTAKHVGKLLQDAAACNVGVREQAEARAISELWMPA